MNKKLYDRQVKALVSEWLYTELSAYARRKNQSMSSVIRFALEDLLAKVKSHEDLAN